MLELLLVPQQELAELLAQAFMQQGIAAELRQRPDGWQLLVPGEEFARAQQLLDDYRRDPRQLNQAAWQGSRATDKPRSLASLSLGVRRFGHLTKLVAGLCVLIYLSRFVDGDRLYRAFLFPEELSFLVYQPWRLFTPALLHFSVLHIAFNLIWWLDLGGQVERKQSPLRLLMLFLLVAAVSNVAQFLASGPLFGGLSGVVYGLLGYVWMQGRLNPASGLALPNPVLVLMLGWLALCWTGLLGPVANWAHLAGLASGLLLGAFFVLQDKSRRPAL